MRRSPLGTRMWENRFISRKVSRAWFLSLTVNCPFLSSRAGQSATHENKFGETGANERVEGKLLKGEARGENKSGDSEEPANTRPIYYCS